MEAGVSVASLWNVSLVVVMVVVVADMHVSLVVVFWSTFVAVAVIERVVLVQRKDERQHQRLWLAFAQKWTPDNNMYDYVCAIHDAMVRCVHARVCVHVHMQASHCQ